MSGAPIYFQFIEKKAAYQALDTLMELGYHVHLLEQKHPDDKSTLQIFVDKNDLTSALEIAQAHGGTVLDDYEAPREEALYSAAYELDSGDPIPAHVVTEDLPESYMTGRAALPGEASFSNEDGSEESFGPSGEDYDHFPAGIRL